MWMGFACASLLSAYPYSGNTFVRFRQRIEGAVAGSCAFFVLYLVTPESFHSLMGPLGGLCLGFCTDYRYKTAMNCFGALMLATGIYGSRRSGDPANRGYLPGCDVRPGVCLGIPPSGRRPAAAPCAGRLTAPSVFIFLLTSLRKYNKFRIILKTVL